MIKDGDVTYMSPKGRRAMQKACRIQRHLPSCKKNCKLTEQFYSNDIDCDKVERKFYKGCSLSKSK